MSTANVNVNANGDCSGGWTCEHRLKALYNMVKFREAVKGTTVHNWWTNNANQIAFSRGSKGFVAINAETSHNLDAYLQTGLRGGMYCDVISGSHNVCSGIRIVVRSDGVARITIPQNAHSAVIVIHVDTMYTGK
ncbi:alpha-amylase 2-like [Saccostrea echinata]|uniref:alpha-amylase 2-like n=1 Tax=Saccostrea echinata TaxID=191078 RepID=UPI002A811EAC|nr:alpha-amylase 2-like [Saccostrea echinata]